MSDRDNATTLMSIELCPECGRHAHFLCAGEKVSGEILSQKQAEELAVDFREDGDISWTEFSRLMSQIQVLGLPMEIPDDMQDLRDLDERLLMFESTLPGFSERDEIDSLHAFLTTFFPEAPMTLQ